MNFFFKPDGEKTMKKLLGLMLFGVLTVAALFFGTGNAWSATAKIHDYQTCLEVARHFKKKIGGAGYKFMGDYNTKGCYYYKSGKYKGRAYWGIGTGKFGYAASQIGKKTLSNKTQTRFDHLCGDRYLRPKCKFPKKPKKVTTRSACDRDWRVCAMSDGTCRGYRKKCCRNGIRPGIHGRVNHRGKCRK
jgi:hypothetical protein